MQISTLSSQARPCESINAGGNVCLSSSSPWQLSTPAHPTPLQDTAVADILHTTDCYQQLHSTVTELIQAVCQLKEDVTHLQDMFAAFLNDIQLWSDIVDAYNTSFTANMIH